MFVWLIAVTVGALWSAGSYLPASDFRRIALPAALRAAAVAIIIALLGDAAVGRARARPPLVALDASLSWMQAADTLLWRQAVRLADSLRADTLLLFGDSVRVARMPLSRPTDRQTLARPLTERVLVSGRPVRVVTDGRVADADALADLPSGSQLVVLNAAARPDAAIVALEVPRVAVSGDTIEARVALRSGGAGAVSRTVNLFLGERLLGAATLPALGAYDERSVLIRAAVPPGEPQRFLRAALLGSDAEPANDTLSTVLETTPAAGAVFVSTSPDVDARDALAVLRGALSIATRGYFRVAPGAWRVDGSLAPVTEQEVRRAALAAPLLVLHGDSAVFGPPRTVARGSLALVVPPRERTGEWFVTGAPASPIAASLSGIAWDSLPPLEVAATVPAGDWVGLEARRGRRFETRPVIVGVERPRRVVVVAAGGFWRWRFRAGASADAFASVWGSVLDWLAAERPDVRAALPAEGIVREGESVRWRRGGTDSSVRVVVRSLSGIRQDTLLLQFAGGQTIAESPALPAGRYEVAAPGGRSLLAVNAASEWLPMRPTLRSGAIGEGDVAADSRRARSIGLLFGLAILLLCAEWVARRQIGLR